MALIGLAMSWPLDASELDDDVVDEDERDDGDMLLLLPAFGSARTSQLVPEPEIGRGIVGCWCLDEKLVLWLSVDTSVFLVRF